jgi:hypothetical protein
MVVNNHSIPKNPTGAGQNPDIEEAVRQAVAAAVRAAVPPIINAQQVSLSIHITVNLQC